MPPNRDAPDLWYHRCKISYDPRPHAIVVVRVPRRLSFGKLCALGSKCGLIRPFDSVRRGAMSGSTHDGHRSTIALWSSVAVMLVGGLAGLILWGAVFVTDFSDFRHMLLHEHFAVMVGLPSAAAGAFIVVSLFRQQEGPITIKGLGFELQ